MDFGNNWSLDPYPERVQPETEKTDSEMPIFEVVTEKEIKYALFRDNGK